MELARPVAAVLSITAEQDRLTEEAFLLLYERTARPLRAYLYRMVNDLTQADDILQETYLRFLQARLPSGMTEEHRKNYLFRIATNLIRDESRTRRAVTLEDCPSSSDFGEDVCKRNDCERYLEQLPVRQRKLLWLAYVEGFTHKEVAETMGLKASSVRPMLARARESLSGILKKGGFEGK